MVNVALLAIGVDMAPKATGISFAFGSARVLPGEVGGMGHLYLMTAVAQLLSFVTRVARIDVRDRELSVLAAEIEGMRYVDAMTSGAKAGRVVRGCLVARFAGGEIAHTVSLLPVRPVRDLPRTPLVQSGLPVGQMARVAVGRDAPLLMTLHAASHLRGRGPPHGRTVGRGDVATIAGRLLSTGCVIDAHRTAGADRVLDGLMAPEAGAAGRLASRSCRLAPDEGLRIHEEDLANLLTREVPGPVHVTGIAVHRRVRGGIHGRNRRSMAEGAGPRIGSQRSEKRSWPRQAGEGEERV